jgi:hypothetical protein
MLLDNAAPVATAVALATVATAAAGLAWRGMRGNALEAACYEANYGTMHQLRANLTTDVTQEEGTPARVWALGAFAVAALLPHLIVFSFARRVARLHKLKSVDP